MQHFDLFHLCRTDSSATFRRVLGSELACRRSNDAAVLLSVSPIITRLTCPDCHESSKGKFSSPRVPVLGRRPPGKNNTHISVGVGWPRCIPVRPFHTLCRVPAMSSLFLKEVTSAREGSGGKNTPSFGFYFSTPSCHRAQKFKESYLADLFWGQVLYYLGTGHLDSLNPGVLEQETDDLFWTPSQPYRYVSSL